MKIKFVHRAKDPITGLSRVKVSTINVRSKEEFKAALIKLASISARNRGGDQ